MRPQVWGLKLSTKYFIHVVYYPLLSITWKNRFSEILSKSHSLVDSESKENLRWKKCLPNSFWIQILLSCWYPPLCWLPPPGSKAENVRNCWPLCTRFGWSAHERSTTSRSDAQLYEPCTTCTKLCVRSHSVTSWIHKKMPRNSALPELWRAWIATSEELLTSCVLLVLRCVFWQKTSVSSTFQSQWKFLQVCSHCFSWTASADGKLNRVDAQSPVQAQTSSQQQHTAGSTQQQAFINPAAAATLPPGYNYYTYPSNMLPAGYQYSPAAVFPVGNIVSTTTR